MKFCDNFFKNRNLFELFSAIAGRLDRFPCKTEVTCISRVIQRLHVFSLRLRRTLKSLEKGIYPTMEDLQRQLTCIAILLDSISTSDEEK